MAGPPPSPSLLVLVLEVSRLSLSVQTPPPAAGTAVGTAPAPSSPLFAALALARAHMMVHEGNRAALLASHGSGCDFLYEPGTAKDAEAGKALAPEEAGRWTNMPKAVLENLKALEARGALADPRPPALAGALARAVSYAYAYRQRCVMRAAAAAAADNASADLEGDATSDGDAIAARTPLSARILLLFGSPDDASAFVPTMNAIFAAERHGIVVDTVALGGAGSPYLQQAAHLTNGRSMTLPEALSPTLLPHLIHTFLPAIETRPYVEEGLATGVDFRATCFATAVPVELGYVCSVCLAVYRDARDTCKMCGSEYGAGLGTPSTTANGSGGIPARS